jgi:AraC-like DNA-binding protein
MKLHIKNMVCDRCVAAVREVLENNGQTVVQIGLGEATLSDEVSKSVRLRIDKQLQEIGFALLDDKKSQLVEQIRTAIIERVHGAGQKQDVNLSEYLKERLGYDYHYLSSRFSEMEGVTIEKYYIAQRIERVKELLIYDELSLAQIAGELNYSSAAYMSNQFKQLTGMTPGEFKRLRQKLRLPLDKV